MSVESVSSDRPDEPDPKDEGDEAIIAMSVAGEVTDSSIVEVGRSRPQFQYSREELMVIKGLPLSKRRPDCLDTVYNNSRGVWDPERWHLDRKRSETPPEEEQRTGGKVEPQPQVPEPQNKRRSGDPRERIRKEQDGIVLSPQRRSFNSGCYVNVTQPPLRRPESPILTKAEVPHREPVRRIGSGRLLTRDMWDFRPENEKMEPERADFSFRSGANTSGRERDVGRDRDNIRERDDRNERFERRPFGRDYGDRDNQRDRGSDMRNDRGHPMDRDKDRGGRKFGNDRRRYEHREPEEPEWFSGGPISQHDTIELRGFDDIPEEKNAKAKKATVAQKKRSKKSTDNKDEKSNDNSAGPKGRSTPTAMDHQIQPVPAPHSPISEQGETTQTSSSVNSKERSDNGSAITESTDRSDANKSREGEGMDFNLDDFLKSDNLPGVSGLLTNGVGATSGSGSRFSQWFKRESPQDDNRGPSIQDELLNNLLNDITEPNIQVPSVTESNTYFAPISPANATSGSQQQQPPPQGAATAKIIEMMMQRANKANQNGQGDTPNNVIQMMKNSSIKEANVGRKMATLEELEARMRVGAPPAQHIEPPRANKSDEDLSAFKKLLAQVTGGQAVPANGPHAPPTQGITLMQLLKNQGAAPPPPMPVVPHPPMMTEPQQQPHPAMFNHVGPLGPAQHPHQAQTQHENLMNVLRLQQHQAQQQQQQQQQHKRQQQSDMLSMMMSGQRMIGASPIPQDMQMLVNNAPSSRELLQRPEALAIIQGLQHGEITRQHLIQQLQNPAMQQRHREVLVNILKHYGNTTPRTISPHSGPGLQDPMIQQLLYQQQQQQRVPSPMSNALCPPAIISSNLAASPNTLSIQHPVMPHRVPSPRDLVMHTQSIMQNALIKTKLEEQRENYRKRQEQQQQQMQQQQQRITSPVNSPSKQMMSPTPLAFTPTSVLRKMTAKEEPDGNSDAMKLAPHNQATREHDIEMDFVSRVARAMEHEKLRSQATQQSQWASQPVNKHPGRPIVKGGGATNQFPYTGPMNFPQQPQQPQQQQQPPPPPQQSPAQRPITSVFGTTARSKHTMSTSLSHPNVSPYNMTPNSIMSQRSDPMNNQIKAQQVQSHLASIQQQQQQQQQQRNVNSHVQLVLNQNYNSNRTDGRVMRPQQQQPMGMPLGRQNSPGSNGGSLSPTSNQLARWFSPEVLAKARAGKYPELGQANFLPVEEVERLQQASTVHD